MIMIFIGSLLLAGVIYKFGVYAATLSIMYTVGKVVFALVLIVVAALLLRRYGKDIEWTNLIKRFRG